MAASNDAVDAWAKAQAIPIDRQADPEPRKGVIAYASILMRSPTL